VRNLVRTGVSAPDEVVDVRHDRCDAAHKDGHEQNLLRRAGAISSGAHRRAMQHVRPGCSENRSRPSCCTSSCAGAQAVAYPSIVASGPNACVLHYRDNNREMVDGDLLLIDAGCEYRATRPISRAPSR
jgi:Xaa-Pro aminopeptidase